MKVAFTSKTGEMIDQHFGMTESFTIWEVGPAEAYSLGTIQVEKHEGDEEDKISTRVALLKDCAIVYTMQIGGPAAAKLVSHKIQPMKTTTEVLIAEMVAKLQGVLQGTPPPWLRKAMYKEKAQPFTEE